MSLPEQYGMEMSVRRRRAAPPSRFPSSALPLLPVRQTLKGALQLCGVSTWSS